MLCDILPSPTWLNYKHGHLAEEECHQQIDEEFNIFSEEVQCTFDQAWESLVADDALIQDLIHDFKTQSNSHLHIFIMSNVSPPNWAILQTMPADWSIFDQVITSGSVVREQTPNLGFYKHVLASTYVDPHQDIFVDNKLENVISNRQTLILCEVIPDS